MAEEIPRSRVTQQHLHGASDSIPGDCFRAAVASIFGLDPSDVPHFAHICDDRPDDDPLAAAWYWAFVGWCALLDPAFDVQTFPPDQWADHTDPDDLLHGCYLLSGPSPRGPWRHTVVGRRGEVVWDPHPSRDGLAGEPDEAEGLVARDG